ncbi:selenocysteine lyase/cysteine desulfurase [Dyadobacter sp. BE34]|uniref:Selenocysteine lyase/cysteine desulfurase n=1 Tax=Dyadobacter fermentans TaxID=94254 RepID=A0ABU1R487_9BACT|nr:MULTISPECIES: aminotransferase class V-fold PLP-dependent enzyme [Dyadobacter]MDR6808226.1 selenocysteine lyase/cysteine desulfurase [Dyadobacter fermentans]MDR7045958.1 selenocysteine lyase/cysteine desulfurase [Dyadobacter sp. BE242]MDR7200271.1 selenocysteine lyase/cysteine desulfurase [Dyadobacter sp. BE34]MDR7218231.1 selenocysteine lyase/cysteine desulfurase [Dyadobacter sp. BE31]MDR7266162.1 selenocysteine lyase/cysteine desulfurase [Dyadobacter sp. BE32]
MNNRRSFFRKSAALGMGAFGINSLFNQLHAGQFLEAEQLWNPASESNEEYWSVIQDAYTASKSEIIILNNGGVSPSPIVVQEALDKYNRAAAQGPSYYMWRIMDKGREPLRQRLAKLAGTDAEEIAINRNATEALNTIIFGLPLEKGDEVIGTLQDYPNMVQAWKQRQMRDGIVYKQLSFDFPIENKEQIVKAYADAITPRTKIIHVTHIINWVGQIMPVKEISQMAHAKGIEVVCDGAHTFGLLDYKIPDLECDYFGTSLHKFLSAPVGSGMMWIKKDKIEKIWPLLCNSEPKSGNIRKFETLGTRSFPIEQAIGEAINFQEGIGSKRKQDRIHYLKKYWAEKAAQIPGVKIHTSLKPEFSCAIAGVSIEGMKPEELDGKLMKDYQIHTVGINWENIQCVRVTPHVYTKTSDLDKLVGAIEKIAKKA